MNFKEYLHKIDENILPGHDHNELGVPVVKKRSRIAILDERGLLSKQKTPVFIQLEDGTRLYMTRYEFERIKGAKPSVGKTLTVSFQRSMFDHGKGYSQVDSVHCEG